MASMIQTLDSFIYIERIVLWFKEAMDNITSDAIDYRVTLSNAILGQSQYVTFLIARPTHFFRKVKKKKKFQMKQILYFTSTRSCFINNNWCDVMYLSLINILSILHFF